MAWARRLRYNKGMIDRSRSRPWLALALVVVVIAALVLALRGMVPGSGRSTLPTPALAGVSPLSTPVSTETQSPLKASGGMALLWVVLGIGLALGLAFVILRWYRHETR